MGSGRAAAARTAVRGFFSRICNSRLFVPVEDAYFIRNVCPELQLDLEPASPCPRVAVPGWLLSGSGNPSSHSRARTVRVELLGARY